MSRTLSLAILVLVLTGCAAAQWKDKVVIIESVQMVKSGFGPGNSQLSALGGQVAGGLGATIAGIFAAGAATSVAAAAAEKTDGVAEVIFHDSASPNLKRSHRQKATTETMSLRYGDKARIITDADGDLIIVKASQ